MAAVLTLWYLYRYDDAVVLITATKLDQTDHLWGEIQQFWLTCPRLQSALAGATLLDRSLKLGPQRYAERSTAAVSTVGGTRQATGAQGAHSEHVLHILEEADGVDQAVYNAKEGSMTSASNRMVMLFNPLRRTGPAYQAMRSDMFAKMNISGFDSPNLAGETLATFLERYHADPNDPWFDEPDVFPGLTGRGWLRDLYRRCGQWEDQEWYGRGLGSYAPSAMNSIFDADLVHALTVPQEWDPAMRPDGRPKYPLQIGIDWAAGRGGDKLAINVAQRREDGYHSVRLEATNYTPDTLDWGMGIIRSHLYYASAIGIDTGGGGEEFYNSVRREIRAMSIDHPPALVRVNFGSSPLDVDSYANKRTEMYFSLRHLMRDGRFHADLPPGVMEQMIEQTYEWVGEGNMRVLPKHLQKERGLASPDELEAICLSVAPLERWRVQQGAITAG